jgi:predicted nicotinamide N-methyase
MELTLAPVPDVPEIRLELAGVEVGLWDGRDGDLAAQQPPYWAFAWAGGKGLARFLLDHPRFVRGKRVLDLGSGSGIVAIAAAKAGAASVCAVDIDADAVAAIGRNAAANAVDVVASAEDPLAGTADADVIAVGDMFYSPRMANRIMRFLRRAQAANPAVRVLVSDPNRGYLTPDRFDELAAYDVSVAERVEQTGSMRATVWLLRAPA